MASRRLSAQFLTMMQRSSIGNGSSTSIEGLTAPCQGSWFASRRLHSDAQAKDDNEQTHKYESEKMINEGGGKVATSFKQKSDELKGRQEEGSQKINEAKESVKETTAETGAKASETAEQAKESVKGKSAEVGEKASETAEQAKESVKGKSAEVGEKASETADEAKGQVSKNVDTAKDMFEDLPQKVSETATGLKEVGVEAGKAVKRDAEKLAQKAGLKTE